MTKLSELMVENKQLKADLERQMAIANEHVNEVERLRDAVGNAASTIRNDLYSKRFRNALSILDEALEQE